MESIIKIGNTIAAIVIMLTIVTFIYSLWIRKNRKIIHQIDPEEFKIYKTFQKRPKGEAVLKKYKNSMVIGNAITLMESKIAYEYADADEDNDNSTEIRKRYPSKGLHGWVLHK